MSATEKLEKLRDQNNKLSEQNKNLGAKIKELQEQYGPLEEIETKVQIYREELVSLEQKVGDYQRAQDILEKKDEILAEAQKTADELTQKSAEAEKQLEQLEDRIGKYEKVEDAVEAAKQRAKVLTDDAEQKAKIITDEADKQAQVTKETAEKEAAVRKKEILTAAAEQEKEILAQANAAKQEAEKTLKEAKEKAKKELRDASDSVSGMYKDLEEEKSRFYEKKDIEGNARKDAIIAEAVRESARAIEKAKQDAQKIADDIRGAADRYEKEKHAAADKYWEEITLECEKRIGEATDRKERIIEEANALREKIVQEGRNLREEENQGLDQKRKEFAAERGEVEQKRILQEIKEKELNQRQSVLDEEVTRRVSEEYGKLISDRDAAKDLYLKVKNAYSELQTRYNQLVSKNNINKEAFSLFEKFLEQAKSKGISVDETMLSRFLNIKKECQDLQKDNQRLSDKNQDLSAENRRLQASLSNSNSTEDKLQAESELNVYYQKKIDGLMDELRKTQGASREDMLLPVRQEPGFFVNDLPYFEEGIDEIEWLNEIKEKSERSGLYFTSRQLYAFHTAHKVHGMSPLVVLAGISGTGKSELPKNYALYGGMQFVSIPVKPDWDSPASLFGYYNSIEKRFEATDLLRAIWQMSRNERHKGQMLMVLLDELNLAHPEQYFADMLSKLETSRGSGDAQYDILLGSGQAPEQVEIGGNILWTGTMNEDETTKGLSDKVIDRSTLITFPRPTQLRSRNENEKILPRERLLSKEVWNSWYKPRRDNEEWFEKQIVEFRKAVENINVHMSKMGRNLGHRVWQGIEAYVRNYPEVVAAGSGKEHSDLDDAMKRAFNDAVAFKIMPKMRGLEVKGRNEAALQEIEKLINTHASELVGDYARAREMTNELFQWSSAEFMNKDSSNSESVKK